ncbi:PAS domain-containing protein [Lysinibacillus sp. KU-BSD001]|uniref:helix-turn-helix transcriptional regulator n=1 Tax=Lysinibacillus sp. KU-BSD001 TaxID=3141328 RepID=UPI0036EA69B6
MDKKQTNRKILENYFQMADMIVHTFGPQCEVVIHDLADVQSSLIYINGTVTNRSLGAPVTDVILKELRKSGNDIQDMLGYTIKTKSNQHIKTSTMFIRNDDNDVIGYIGINYDMTAFKYIQSVLDDFISAKPGLPNDEMNESYANNVEEIFEQIIQSSLLEVHVPVEKMSRQDKIRFVQILDDKGIFLIHGAVDKVSDILQVSKQTIYNYLDVIKNS